MFCEPIFVFIKIPCDDERLSKICSSCAHCLIMANLFRVKVIDSNGKYREFIEAEYIKREQELEEETMGSIEMKDESFDYDDPMSDDEMQVEFLNDFLNAVEAAETIQLVKAPPKKIVRLSHTNKEIAHQKPDLKEKNVSPCKEEEEEDHEEQSTEPVCFICTEPAQKKNLFSPYKDTLNRIIPVRNCGPKEFLCQKCIKKLENSKTFFLKLDAATKETVKKNCCQFCSVKVASAGKTLLSTIETFMSLHKSRQDFIVKVDAKTCMQCNQLLKRIRMLRNCYNAKEKFYEKKQNSNRRNAGPRKKYVTLEGRKVSDDVRHNNFMDNAVVPTTKRRAKKRLRLRAHPKYVQPDPDEPLPEDYQCHMSDFEEIESETEVPAVPFRSPLNVPFKHKYLNCPDCNFKFVNSCEMDVHFEIIHGTTSEVCDICQKAFKDLKQVRDHKIACHTIDFSGFNFRKLCDICGQAKRKFENHYAIHFDVRAFKCQLCSCDYKTKASLEDHIRTVHMGEKRHKCAYCDKRFSYAADKARHEIGVHTKKFKHICQFCGKCFLKKNFLTAHQKSQHSEMLLEMTSQSQE